MTAAELAAVLTAVAGILTAVVALIHAFQAKRTAAAAVSAARPRTTGISQSGPGRGPGDSSKEM